MKFKDYPFNCDILFLVNGTKVTRTVRGQMNIRARIFRMKNFHWETAAPTWIYFRMTIEKLTRFAE